MLSGHSVCTVATIRHCFGVPAVLVEVGFISNREEERVLSRAEFQRGVAGALAKGIRDFFERYPPGQGVAVQGAPR